MKYLRELFRLLYNIEDLLMTIADDMKAALPQLQASHGLSADQVNAVVSQAIQPLQTSIQGILDSEKSDADKLADITSAMGELTTAFAPAAPTPSPAPITSPVNATPTTPVPDSAPPATAPAA